MIELQFLRFSCRKIEPGVTKVKLTGQVSIIGCVRFLIKLQKKIPLANVNRVKKFWNRFNCAPARWALEKERRREGECLTLPLNLFKKQRPYLPLPMVRFAKSKSLAKNWGQFTIPLSNSDNYPNTYTILYYILYYNIYYTIYYTI